MCRGKGGGGDKKTESDKKRLLLWKVNRHKRVANSRWKHVKEVEEFTQKNK